MHRNSSLIFIVPLDAILGNTENLLEDYIKTKMHMWEEGGCSYKMKGFIIC